MRHTDLTNLGGFLWWLIVKLTKTNLKDEQSRDNWSRNLFFVILLFLLISFISIKIL